MSRDEGWVLDMLDATRKIAEYTCGLDEASFYKSTRDQDAVIRRFAILGEAAKRISPEFQKTHPEIPWRKIAGFRDVIVHDYFNVDLKRVWRLAKNEIPSLITLFEPLIPPETA